MMEDGDLDEAVQWHLGENMTHNYFLDTIEKIRSTPQCFFDTILILMIACFMMAGFAVLREKKWIENYHSEWIDKDSLANAM